MYSKSDLNHSKAVGVLRADGFTLSEVFDVIPISNLPWN